VALGRHFSLLAIAALASEKLLFFLSRVGDALPNFPPHVPFTFWPRQTCYWPSPSCSI